MTGFPSLLMVAVLLVHPARAHSESEARSMDGWQHRVAVRVVERAGVPAPRFPASLALDVRRLAEEGKARPDGTDLRVTIGSEEVPSQTEGLADGRMLVTFQVDLEAGQARDDVVLHYGNPDAAAPHYDTAWGKINPRDALLETATSIAATMAGHDPLGLRMTKEAINVNLDAGGLEAALELEDRNQTMLMLAKRVRGS